MQEVRWNKVGRVRAEHYKFSMEKEMIIINSEGDFLNPTEWYQHLRE